MREIDYTELVGADIQIGAVEIKDASTDARANVVDTIFGKGLVTKTEIIQSIPKRPTFVVIDVPPGSWILIANLPDDVVEWTLKPRNPNVEYRLSYNLNWPIWITVWRGTVISSNTNPGQIYVYQDTGSYQLFELEYWQP